MATKKSKEIAEFGDFQTPIMLARRVCHVLSTLGTAPASVVEPTCGRGAFLQAALETFPDVTNALGLDINATYVEAAAASLANQPFGEKATVVCADFFQTNWSDLWKDLPAPILVVGNLPWVTNAELTTLGSANLPQKSNFQKRAGLDALTGKSNFDISEWMLIKLMETLNGRRATLAMLCKTAVARKLLSHAWRHKASLQGTSIHRIDAERHFGAAVDACLLVCNLAPNCDDLDCAVFEQLEAPKSHDVIGYRDSHVIADIEAYNRLKHLQGISCYRWRSGVKHDCGKVMELTERAGRLVNGHGETVDLEPNYLFPLLKSSEIANGATPVPKRSMLVTQKHVGEDTAHIETDAPKTWAYLTAHGAELDRRGSAIYRKRSRFAVFGVGDYSFAPYKVAISGFYKKLHFAVIGPHFGKPVVLDDTIYFVPCQSKEEAEIVAALLNSELARAFYSAFIFWDSKRPITVEVLRQLDLMALAKELGRAEIMREFLQQSASARLSDANQLCLFHVQ